MIANNNQIKNLTNYLLFLAPLIATFLAFTLTPYIGWKQSITVGITVLCALWWVFEVIPIPITSLIPFFAFPVFGVLTHKQTASSYGHHIILLMMGGMMMSKALESSGAHRCLAHSIIRIVGGRDKKRFALGMMVTAAVVSMWMSNTATTIMLLPIGYAVLEDYRENDSYKIKFFLGLAYAANIGGFGTPIGTPPNAICIAQLEEFAGITLSFFSWMLMAVPIVLVSIPLLWIYLMRGIKGTINYDIDSKCEWTSRQKRTLICIIIIAIGWMTRPIWTSQNGLQGIGDSSIALFGVVLLFLVRDKRNDPLLTWQDASDIPWDVILLFGGGLVIAQAFTQTGLSTTLGSALSNVLTISPIISIAIVCFAVTFITEFTSNTATSSVLMPILSAAAIAARVDPLTFMFPATISASCAFMLPVATAPNAIVFSTGYIKTRDMVKIGFIVNLSGVLIITLFSVMFGSLL